MPRYLVQRTFADRLEVPPSQLGATCRRLVDNNTAEQVTWIQSFVSADRTTTFCVYEGPTPESIRRAAASSDLPVDAITEVSVLDPYSYVGASS